MEEYSIDNSYRVMGRDSNGSQEKYLYNGKWFKVNSTGNEALAEKLVSDILECVCEKPYFVRYEMCTVNGKLACVSDNFLSDGEQFISFQKLYYSKKHSILSDDIMAFDDVKARRHFLLETLNAITGIDLGVYVDYTLCLDALTLNPDRHFFNMGVIKTQNGFRVAPIFDNGQALGLKWNITPPDIDIEECVQTLATATLSGSPDLQLMATRNRFTLDTSLLRNVFVNKARPYELFAHQLGKYREIFIKR